MDDLLISVVFVPVGLAWYFIGGITGQSVATADLWAHSLVCLVLPGVIYGYWLERQKRMFYIPRGNW